MPLFSAVDDSFVHKGCTKLAANFSKRKHWCPRDPWDWIIYLYMISVNNGHVQWEMEVNNPFPWILWDGTFRCFLNKKRRVFQKEQPCLSWPTACVSGNILKKNHGNLWCFGFVSVGSLEKMFQSFRKKSTNHILKAAIRWLSMVNCEYGVVNSPYFHVLADGHQPNKSWSHYFRISYQLKVGWVYPPEFFIGNGPGN